MMLSDDSNYYDLLEVRIDATPSEIREAYIRVKTTYKRENAALYTLITAEESAQVQARIEDAYRVLSDPEKRRAYDQAHGHITFDERPKAQVIPLNPPRDTPLDGTSELLIPPQTDFAPAPLSPSSAGTSAFALQREDRPALATTPVSPKTVPLIDPLLAVIQAESEWRGNFLKMIREQRRLSLEEISTITRVNKHYIVAIEEENYPKLPAPVFVRGFITQLARALKLPHDKVVAAYMARYQQSHVGK